MFQWLMAVDDKGFKWVSRIGNKREGENLTKSRGGPKRINYDKFEIAKKIINQKN